MLILVDVSIQFDDLYIYICIIFDLWTHPFCWNCRLVGKCRYWRL